MDFDLTDEQNAIRRLVRDFAEQEVRPVAAELDREKRFPYELVARLGELGLMGIPYPEEYGGGGADTLSYAIAIEELARVDSSIAITVAAHTSLGTFPIYAFGTKEQKERWLPDLCSGRKLWAFGLTEPEAGSDAGNTRTTARLEDGEWVIDGAKQFITNAGTDITGGVTITARTGPDEISNIIVPQDTPGYTVEPAYRKMGWNASDTRPLSFNGARVPEENLLGPRGAGFEIAQARLGPGRIHHCMRAIGAAERALELMCRRANAREAFGGPLAEKQFVQDFVARSRIEIDAARLMVLHAAWKMDTAGKREARQEISMIKVVAANVCMDVLDRAIQVHGALGVSDDTPLAVMWRQLRMLRLADGPDEVHKMVIARRELNRWKDDPPTYPAERRAAETYGEVRTP